ncbi:MULTISPECIES: hypothetical protein [Clostridium]|uniref:Uncharacterized protein n=1 Tax=Clostridium frigoriphilum TaxID=443253 RepID=A0ABU7UKP6_9CLOT|nr:hypothetical protein [Clostridium sp. DSM 17811]MBU3097675.1 hypothetical protein [Clostridium sp. DSM 17811]
MKTMIKSLLSSMDFEYLEVRTKKAIEEFGIENLMEYTVDSVVGCDIGDFYKTIVEGVIIEDTYVAVSEISDGKYEVTIEFEGKDRWYISSYAWDSVEIVIENLINNVMIPHIKRGRISWENQYIA